MNILLHGVTVTLRKPSIDGNTKISVDNVLIGEPTTDEQGAIYTLAIPKTDTNDWTAAVVDLPEPFSVTTFTKDGGTVGITENIPLIWNRKVQVHTINPQPITLFSKTINNRMVERTRTILGVMHCEINQIQDAGTNQPLKNQLKIYMVADLVENIALNDILCVGVVDEPTDAYIIKQMIPHNYGFEDPRLYEIIAEK